MEPTDCARCQALERRIAELERQLANPPTETPFPPLSLRRCGLPAKDGARTGRSGRRRREGLGWTKKTHAYQCLPMVVANQWGWQVLCPADVVVTWNGRADKSGLTVEVDPKYAPAIKSQFGVGIVTFTPPWLFRTSPGWDLYAKGPSNRWKTNCVALEGVIETWWLNYTFTFNWKLVEPGVVIFREGESLGQLVPVPTPRFPGPERWRSLGEVSRHSRRGLPMARGKAKNRQQPGGHSQEIPEGRGRSRASLEGARSAG